MLTVLITHIWRDSVYWSALFIYLFDNKDGHISNAIHEMNIITTDRLQDLPKGELWPFVLNIASPLT